MKNFARFLAVAGFSLKVGAALLGVFVFCAISALVLRPDLDADLPEYPEDSLEKLREVRRLGLGDRDLPRIQVPVDYGEGPRAAWYPKGEAPVLAELVEENKLPPVEERVGSEPLVMRGVDGIGDYGGSLVRGDDGGLMYHRMTYASLLRFSPFGYPIVPHIAKSFTVSDDNRVFTFRLREGMRWSDGHPCTADDILYWWNREQADESVLPSPESFMLINGRPPEVEKLDAYTVRFTFPEPYARFLVHAASFNGAKLIGSPRHYLEKFHPEVGDRDLIEEWKDRLSLPNDKEVYKRAKNLHNPEHPRMWQWIYRSYKSTPPHVFVRNPYYFVVDPEGNQLPYIDRVIFKGLAPRMMAIAASGGEIDMQRRYLKYDDYTLLMAERENGDYEVRHWLGSRSWWTLFPNLDRKVEDKHPASAEKRRLLADKRFRQALSLAINRPLINRALYHNQAPPGNDLAGPESPFHHPDAFQAYTRYDPGRANQLLDELGLTRRDSEGYRTTPEGERLTFRIAFTDWTGLGPGHFVVDDWAEVGIRAVLKEQARSLFGTQAVAGTHDFFVFEGEGEYLPLLNPVHVYGTKSIQKWFERGGLYGNPKAGPKYGGLAPPEGGPLREAMEISMRLDQVTGLSEQKAVIDRINDIFVENLWNINITASPPILAVVKNSLRNVPEKVIATWMFQTPGNAGPALFYFADASTDPSTTAQIQKVLQDPGLDPRLSGMEREGEAGVGSGWLAAFFKWSFLLIGLLLVVLAAMRSPHIVRRLVIMAPTLLLLSVLVFTVIQLPPGDYITTYIQQLEETGDEVDPQEIRDLEEMFYLNDPLPLRYLRWMGFKWFLTFDQRDAGLLQGNLGRSMQNQQPVTAIVGDRVLLTVGISLGTILFTWLISIPIGIYSAVRPYTLTDYLFTLFGFIGMCVPGFLLAIILMYLSQRFFGEPITGLFSAEYAAMEGWTFGKFIDLMKHIWVPVLILGVSGTASGIRFMRANLMDELKKPYVTTARAKGVPPMRLLLKYPVRLALNPFVSGIGGLFPQLLSGGAIVAIVLSLPTVSPLMLQALMNEDMYMAGSMLMVLSLLAMVGTLVSDLLLMVLDPRIRLEGRAK